MSCFLRLNFLDQNFSIVPKYLAFLRSNSSQEKLEKESLRLCSIPGIVLKDWLMKIVNTRINELFLFKSLSEKQYVNNVKLSKRN